MLPLVAVSGAECVAALAAAGFRISTRQGDLSVLRKETRTVSVRDAGMLTPDELLCVIREAGLAYSDFLDLLSEAPTDPDVRRPATAAPAARAR